MSVTLRMELLFFFCADCARLQNAERIATEFDEKLNTER